MDLASIHEIEDLHHHKGIEDEGEMSRIDLCFFKGSGIIIASCYGVKPSTTHSTAYFSVVPLVLWIGHELGLGVETVGFLRNEGFSHKD